MAKVEPEGCLNINRRPILERDEFALNRFGILESALF